MGNSLSQPKVTEGKKKAPAPSDSAAKGHVRLMLCKGNPRNTPMPSIPSRNRQIEQFNWAKFEELQNSARYTPKDVDEIGEAPTVPSSTPEEASYLCDCPCHTTMIENDMQTFNEENQLNATLNMHPNQSNEVAADETADSDSWSNIDSYCISSDSSTSDQEISSFNCPSAPDNTHDDEWHTKDCLCIKCLLSQKLEHLRSLEKNKKKKTVIYHPNESTEIEMVNSSQNEEHDSSRREPTCPSCLSVLQQAGLQAAEFSTVPDGVCPHIPDFSHNNASSPHGDVQTEFSFQAWNSGFNIHKYHWSWSSYLKKCCKNTFLQLDAGGNPSDLEKMNLESTNQTSTPEDSSDVFTMTPLTNITKEKTELAPFATSEDDSKNVGNSVAEFQTTNEGDNGGNIATPRKPVRHSNRRKYRPDFRLRQADPSNTVVLNRFSRKTECPMCCCSPMSAKSHDKLLGVLGINIVSDNAVPAEEVYASEDSCY